MARTIDYWYQQLVASKNATAALNPLNSTSKVSNWNLWLYVVAVVMASLDNVFDLHRAAVDAALAAKTPHRLTWYRDLALRFQFGQQLIPETDKYANTGLTDTQIAAQKIIVQAAVTEIPAGTSSDDLRIKIVKLANGDFTPLAQPEIDAFKTYINVTKDAGVHIVVNSLAPDSLRLSLDVFYNPLVLRNDGSRIDGNAQTPVPDAINAYLKNLKFNGEFANTRLDNAIQAVDGVSLVSIKLSQAKYGLFPFANIDEVYIPDAGYMRIAPGDLTINYRQYVQY